MSAPHEPEPPPEEDPEAAIEALAGEDAALAPARRRRAARAALSALRDARRAARIGLALAALAVLLAAGTVVLGLTGAVGGGEAGQLGEGSVTEEIVVRAEPATVLVRVRGGQQRAAGSGFVLDAEEGLVVTNFHVVGAGGEIEAGRPGGMEEARIRAAAPCEDLALLEVEAEGLRDSLPLGSQAELRQGDPVVALGFPASASGGRQLTTTAGVVSAVRTPLRLPIPHAPRFPNLVQTDAALAPGNSGGPLVGDDGRLVGVNTALIHEIGGRPVGAQGYALGVDRVKEVLGDLREGRSRGWFGASLLFPPRALLAREGLPEGVLTATAFDGTSADDVDLEDVLITAIGGRPVGSAFPTYCDAVAGIESGERSEVTVIADAASRRPRNVAVEFE